MRQKEILGSHFANAYECTKANELIESGQIRPVLWRTLGFEGVAEAHQLMLENKHLGKISILVGAERRGSGQDRRGSRRHPRRGRRLMAGGIDRPERSSSRGTPRASRATRLEAALNEVAPLALRYGASSYAVYRARDDRYKFQQLAHFERNLDWERYWEGPEMIELRTRYSGAYQVPVLYGWWDLTSSAADWPRTDHGGQRSRQRRRTAPLTDWRQAPARPPSRSTGQAAPSSDQRPSAAPSSARPRSWWPLKTIALPALWITLAISWPRSSVVPGM